MPGEGPLAPALALCICPLWLSFPRDVNTRKSAGFPEAVSCGSK